MPSVAQSAVDSERREQTEDSTLEKPPQDREAQDQQDSPQEKWQDILAPANARSVTIRIGTYDHPPFVSWDGQQTYGYSIDLWQEIATGIDVRTEYVRYDDVLKLLDAVRTNAVDVGVAGISITAAREGAGLDFSYPVYRGGLQMMVNRKQVHPLVKLAESLGGVQTFVAVFRIFALSFIAGALIWFFERKRNSEFPDRFLPGVGQGIWFAFVTLGTFGYGDVTPKTLRGRLIASVWMAFSFFVLGDFISSLTAVRQTHVEGPTLRDLQGQNVGAMDGTSAFYYIRNEPIHVIGYPSFDEAVLALRQDEVVAVVGDYPTVRYVVFNDDGFELSGGLLDHESYGLVTSEGNELLLEAIDRELLKLERSGRLAQLETTWFGTE